MLKKIRQLKYAMIIPLDDQDDIFVVTVPELPGCRTHGKTYEEAVRQGQDAIESWLMVSDDLKETPPPPYTFVQGLTPLLSAQL